MAEVRTSDPLAMIEAMVELGGLSRYQQIEEMTESPIDKLILPAAVCIDKMRLLRSEPTSINQQRGLSVLQQFNQQINNR